MDSQRLDYLVANKLGVSRSIASQLIETGKVKTDGITRTKPSQKISGSVKLDVGYRPSVKPLKLSIGVIYEDKNCVVIDKPAGLLAHSKGAFNTESTIASWLAPKTHGFSGTNRDGIVHRLDRGTSGVMICAKNPDSLSHFQKQFSSRKVKKKYYALVENKIDPTEAIIDIPIERNPKDPKRFKPSSNGKPAMTTYKTIKSFIRGGKGYTLLELTPKTGRTHQLRVHLAYLKHPIAGDDFYGGVKAKRLYLHAHSLEITLPGGERKTFASDLPSSFSNPKILDNG